LSDFIAIKDGQLCLPPLFFSSHQLGEFIDYLCTTWLYALFEFCAIFVMSVYILLVLDLCIWRTNKYSNNKYISKDDCMYIFIYSNNLQHCVVIVLNEQDKMKQLLLGLSVLSAVLLLAAGWLLVYTTVCDKCNLFNTRLQCVLSTWVQTKFHSLLSTDRRTQLFYRQYVKTFFQLIGFLEANIAAVMDCSVLWVCSL